MRFHHVCLCVSDMEKSLKMWTELFDFTVQIRFCSPGDPGPTGFDESKLDEMEEMLGRRDAVIDCALLTSPDGAMLEVQEAHNPVVRKTPEEYNSYFVTGMRELAFRVDDIDGWFEKVKAAGFRPTTDAVWDFGENARSFLFYDDDDIRIQLWEDSNSTWI